MAARTSRIEIGTGVIDMRYENPLYMAEEAAATDLLGDGRLQLGISRGSPETALRGSEAFGYVPPEGVSDADLARDKTALFLAAVEGQAVVDADPRMTGGRSGRLPGPAAVAPGARADLVGLRDAGHSGVDGEAGTEPDEFHPAHRGHRRAVR